MTDLNAAVDAQINSVFYSAAGREYAKAVVSDLAGIVIDDIAAGRVVNDAEQVKVAMSYVKWVYEITAPQ